MENGSYNKISGRKTLILVVALIVVIIILSVYTVFMMVKKSSVITNSSYFEKPAVTEAPSPTIQINQPFPERSGD
jgi:flagellar basal body-associated protein FliL